MASEYNPDNMYPYGYEKGSYPKYDRAERLRKAEIDESLGLNQEPKKGLSRDTALILSSIIAATTLIPTFGMLLKSEFPISKAVDQIVRMEDRIKEENPSADELALIKEELIIQRNRIGANSPARNSYLGLFFLEIGGVLAPFGLKDYLKYRDQARSKEKE
jgi:hypothetical protein